MTRHSAVIAVLLCGLGLASRSAGQEVSWAFDGREIWWMVQVRPVGDADLDGVTDLVLGAFSGGSGCGGTVTLVSGASGNPIHAPICGPQFYAYGQRVEGVGDFDGDGWPDFASGVFPNNNTVEGEVYVWSGKTADLLAFIPSPFVSEFDERFGWRVEALGDLDQDGHGEFAVCFLVDGYVLIYSGPNAELFRMHREYALNGTGFGLGGASVDSIGDLDGDGSPEYVAGWYVGDGNAPGMVVVFDGASGDELHRIYADTNGPASLLGQSVAGMGDVDGDGTADFAAGATFDNTFTCQNSGDRGYARIYSGSDWSLLRQIDGSRILQWSAGCPFYQLSGGEDVNGDGIGDLLVSFPNANPYFDQDFDGTVRGYAGILSGATGTMLWRVLPDHNGALLGDLDGDGLAEFAHGNRYESSVHFHGGRITVYRGFPGDAQRVCTAAPNSTGNAARIDFDGPISIGNDMLHLVVEGAVPGESGYFIYGPDFISQPFGDGTLCAGPGSIGLSRLGGPVQLDAQGFAMVKVEMTQPPVDKGPNAWSPGSTWTVQCVYRDPMGPGGSGFNTSDAMLVTFVP